MNALKRHLAIILSVFIIFAMCPAALYASTIDPADAAAPEITAQEQSTAPDENIVDETESRAEELIDEAAYVPADEAVDETDDVAAPAIEETVAETAPDTDEYTKEPAPETEEQDITPAIDALPESEELVGAPVSVGTNVTATFNSSTGEVVLTSNNGTLSRDWINKGGFDRYKIKSIKVASGTVYFPANSSSLFWECNNLKTLDMVHFNSSKITSANFMFYQCMSLESLYLDDFQTSKCTEMVCMFEGCQSLKSLNLYSFNTSKVESMLNMFSGCSSLKVLDLSTFDTTNVYSMQSMFAGCTGLTHLNLSNFKTPDLQEIQDMFYMCTNLVSVDMSGFDLSKVKKADEFGNTYTLFRKCPNLKLLKTPKKNTIARDMPVTLYDQAGKSYSTLPVTSKSLLLARPKQLAKGTIIVGDGVTASMDSSGAVSFYSDNGTLWNNWRNNYPDLVYATSLKVAYGTMYLPADSSSLFNESIQLASVDFTNVNTSKVTSMYGMFSLCYQLKALDLSKFNTSKVTNMHGMFYGCQNLKALDLSMFDTSKVTSIDFMFGNCFELKILDLSSFNLSKDTASSQAFFGTKLYLLKAPKYDKLSTPLPGPLYDSAGKKYTAVPNLSKSIVLAKSKQLAKDCETYGKLFTDVLNPSHPYYKAIYWAAQKGITKGYSDGSFGIDLPCTRGHAVMFLWRMAGCPEPKPVSKSPFSDVPMTHTFFKAVLWAQQKGITKGYTSGPNKGKFGINDTCTRGQIMMFIWRYKGQPKPKPVSKSPFSDVPMNHPFYQAILWGSQKGVTNGYTDGPNKGKFGVNDNCTRGQIVTFLYRIR